MKNNTPPTSTRPPPPSNQPPPPSRPLRTSITRLDYSPQLDKNSPNNNKKQSKSVIEKDNNLEVNKTTPLRKTYDNSSTIDDNIEKSKINFNGTKSPEHQIKFVRRPSAYEVNVINKAKTPTISVNNINNVVEDKKEENNSPLKNTSGQIETNNNKSEKPSFFNKFLGSNKKETLSRKSREQSNEEGSKKDSESIIEDESTRKSTIEGSGNGASRRGETMLMSIQKVFRTLMGQVNDDTPVETTQKTTATEGNETKDNLKMAVKINRLTLALTNDPNGNDVNNFSVRVFAVPLENVVIGNAPPSFLEKLFEFLAKEKVFDNENSAFFKKAKVDDNEVKTIMVNMNGGDYSYFSSENPNVNYVIEIFYRWLNLLPQPLFQCKTWFLKLEKEISDHNEFIHLLHSLINLTPIQNKIVLKHIYSCISQSKFVSQKNNRLINEISKRLIDPIYRSKETNEAVPKRSFNAFLTNYDELFANKFTNIEYFSSNNIVDYTFGEGLITAGSREALFEKFYDNYYKMIDPEFTEIILVTHTYFMKSEELLTYFIEKYKKSKSSHNRETFVRSKIIKNLFTWFEFVDSNKLVHFSKQMVGVWSKFQRDIKEEKGSQIFSIAEKLKSTPMKETQPESFVDKPLPDKSVDCLEYTVKDLSISFTFYAHYLFCKIKIPEILHSNWMKKEKSPNYTKFVADFNNMQLWTCTQILKRNNETDRLKAFTQLINVCYECAGYNNFHTSFAIFAGLSSSNIFRMKKHWKKIEKSVLTKYTSLSNLFSPAKNHKNYQERVQECKNVSMIPIVGIIGKFLFAIEENNPSILSNGLLNFQKFRMLYVVTQQIKRISSKTFSLERTDVNLLKIFIENNLEFYDDKKLYELSLEYEPREQK